MSRRDPGAATGQAATPTPPPCACGHAEGLHALTPAGRRRCSAFPCQCKTYRELITSHVYRTKPPSALKGVPEDGCAYAGCGEPPDAHQRRVSRRRPAPVCAHCHGPQRGYASIGDVPLCHPDDGMDCYRLVTLYGHGIDCLSCIHQRRVTDSGPGRVAPAGGRGAGERDPGRDTPAGAP